MALDVRDGAKGLTQKAGTKVPAFCAEPSSTRLKVT